MIQQTHITRTMKEEFDPERHCPYTGSTLTKITARSISDRSKFMTLFTRDSDGCVIKLREATESEIKSLDNEITEADCF